MLCCNWFLKSDFQKGTAELEFTESIQDTCRLAVLCVDVSELEEAKKASEAAAAQQLLQQNQQLGASQSTPDYAVGLTAMNPPTPAPATPSYSPATPQHTVTTIIAIPRDAAGEGPFLLSHTFCDNI